MTKQGASPRILSASGQRGVPLRAWRAIPLLLALRMRIDALIRR